MELWLYIIPFILVLGAQAIVSTTYNKYKTVLNKKGVTGFDVARQILDKNDLTNIKVVATDGVMSDHYDPKAKVIRLSHEVYNDSTIAAIAIAAHECGHAIQHKRNYIPIVIRNILVPVTNFASKIGYLILIIGLMASFFDLVIWGLVLLCATLLFQLVTLPVEFNASGNAIRILSKEQLIESSETSAIKAVLTAAAFTYVASLIANFLEILRLFLIFRNRD